MSASIGEQIVAAQNSQLIAVVHIFMLIRLVHFDVKHAVVDNRGHVDHFGNLGKAALRLVNAVANLS